jgi:KUP system potassium uptake protein
MSAEKGAHGPRSVRHVLRADNQGEGGILALLALTPERMRGRGQSIGFVALLVIAGASLLYGDGMITPAISVLSAVEGLGEEASSLKQYVVPITCALLVVLFAIQSRGTLSRNSRPATNHFKLPPGQVIEIGTQIDL